MTNYDLRINLPDIIQHKTWGYGQLEIIVDNPSQKGAYYKHKENGASFGTYDSSWQEVYDELSTQLKEDGYM